MDLRTDCIYKVLFITNIFYIQKKCSYLADSVLNINVGNEICIIQAGNLCRLCNTLRSNLLKHKYTLHDDYIDINLITYKVDILLLRVNSCSNVLLDRLNDIVVLYPTTEVFNTVHNLKKLLI